MPIRRMAHEATAEQSRQMRIVTHRVAGVHREPSPATFQEALQRRALRVRYRHLRGIADEQVAGLDGIASVIVRQGVGTYAPRLVQRLGQTDARKVEIVVPSWAATDEVGQSWRGHGSVRWGRWRRALNRSRRVRTVVIPCPAWRTTSRSGRSTSKWSRLVAHEYAASMVNC